MSLYTKLCLSLYGPASIVFSLIYTLRANQPNLLLVRILGGASGKAVIELTQCAVFLHSSFPVIWLRGFHDLCIGEWILF